MHALVDLFKGFEWHINYKYFQVCLIALECSFGFDETDEVI